MRGGNKRERDIKHKRYVSVIRLMPPTSNHVEGTVVGRIDLAVSAI